MDFQRFPFVSISFDDSGSGRALKNYQTSSENLHDELRDDRPVVGGKNRSRLYIIHGAGCITVTYNFYVLYARHAFRNRVFSLFFSPSIVCFHNDPGAQTKRIRHKRGEHWTGLTHSRAVDSFSQRRRRLRFL